MSDTTTTIIIVVTICGFFVVAGAIALIVLLSLADNPTCCLGCQCYVDRHHPADPGLVESAQMLRRNSFAHISSDPLREAFSASLSQQSPLPYTRITSEPGTRLTPVTAPSRQQSPAGSNFNNSNNVFVSPRTIISDDRDGR